MAEVVPEALEGEAAAFADALPAAVKLPAGTGKTHLLAATARHIVGHGGQVLVLTHTNAGVAAIRARMKRFGLSNGVHVTTIASFAFRLVRSYPVIGQLQAPQVMLPGQSTAYTTAATRIAEASHIQAILAASYSHLLVDEYQDCSEAQHAFILALRQAVPATGIFGDPLQAIFGFAEPLADWTSVLNDFPLRPVNIKPHRWVGHNESLGAWLLQIRPFMVPQHTVKWRTISLPPGVTFRRLDNPERLSLAQLPSFPPDESVLIIADQDWRARNLAGNFNGAFTLMEELAGKFMARQLSKLVTCEPDSYALWLFDLTKECHCGHRALDPGTLRKRYVAGRTAADLLGGRSRKREGVAPAIRAFDTVVSDPSLTNMAVAMDTISRSPALRLHSHEAWGDIQTAVRGAAAHGEDPDMLLSELAKARDILRYAGRRERRRIISRTLLVKGLEYDHVVIADVAHHDEVNDLYVALSRARKTVTIFGSSDTLLLKPSPNRRSSSSGAPAQSSRVPGQGQP